MADSITAQTEIEAPARDVFAQWSRLEDLPAFLSMVDSVERIDEERSHWVVTIGGVRREFDARLTDVLPNRHIAWASEGEHVHTGVVRFEPVDAERTRVRLEMSWVPDGLVEKAGALLDLDDRAAARSLARFKEHMEGGPRDRGLLQGTDPDVTY